MKTLLRILPLVCIASLICLPSSVRAGNTGRITGKVTAKSGEVLAGAVITVFRQNQGGGTISFTRADRRGAYSLANLTPGSYYLQVTRDGYEPLTTSDVTINPGKTTSLNLILQEFIAYISNDDDPRNWDLQTVMRSSSERRMIFRDLPGERVPVNSEGEPKFDQSAAVNIASTARLSEDMTTSPRSGLVSNFAFSQAVGEHGRMLFSGQLNSSDGSLWRVRDTYEYSPYAGRQFRLSLGYGRLNLGPGTLGSIRSSQFFAQDSSMRESGVQTLALGFEASNDFMDILTLDYGLDYSRVVYGSTKSVFSPYVEIVLTPWNNWKFKTAMMSRRQSDINSLSMPDGEVLNLSEPTMIAKAGNDIQLTQLRHSEVALERSLPESTSVEVAMFKDETHGPGFPLLMTMGSGAKHSSMPLYLNGRISRQHGLRVAVNRRLLDFLSGSVSYVYGSGSGLGEVDESVTGERLAESLAKYLQSSYFSSFSSQLDASIPWTKTSLTTVLRWYPGSPLTPLDVFSDRSDMMTKGVNFRIRQVIPVPDFMSLPGQWEALVDVGNMFDQGRDFIRTADGEIIIARNPRSLRFGLNLKLY